MRIGKPYPTDVGDEARAFVAPYLTLMDPEAPQRKPGTRSRVLRAVFDALRQRLATPGGGGVAVGSVLAHELACR